MNKQELQDLLHEAEDAFWQVVAKHFPVATTGDLSPWATFRLSQAQEEAVTEWIGNNVTSRPGDIAPGYRFELLYEVDRFPDFLAPAGLTGIITRIDESGVWGRMDERLSGAEHWENEIHWEETEQFSRDTMPLKGG
jgi:hypothetical protein